MYSNVHGTVGALIVLSVYAVTNDMTTAMVLGGATAFLSHDPLDRLGEKAYGDMNTTIAWEVVPLVLFSYMAFMSGLWPLYLTGWVAANGMDIIDKKGYLSILWREKFKSGHFFKCHRRQPDVQFTVKQTKLITILSSITLAVTTLFLLST